MASEKPAGSMGERLRMARKLRAKTGVELAREVGVTPSMIYRYESGEKVPGRETLIGLADALNVSLDYIVTGSPLWGQRNGALADAISGKQAKAVGKRIREARERKGWTQAELSDKVGVSRNTLGRWERGQDSPTIDALMVIAYETDLRVSFFAGGTGVLRSISLYEGWVHSLRWFCATEKPEEMSASWWHIALLGLVAAHEKQQHSVLEWADMLAAIQTELGELGGRGALLYGPERDSDEYR